MKYVLPYRGAFSEEATTCSRKSGRKALCKNLRKRKEMQQVSDTTLRVVEPAGYTVDACLLTSH